MYATLDCAMLENVMLRYQVPRVLVHFSFSYPSQYNVLSMCKCDMAERRKDMSIQDGPDAELVGLIFDEN